MALLAEVLEHARLLNLALELLEGPVEAIGFVENYFNHALLGKRELVKIAKEEAGPIVKIGPAPTYAGKTGSKREA